MRRSPPSQAPRAHLTLRAHTPAPARVELAYQPLIGRALRTAFWLTLCWGSIPFVLWLPPHYPWVTSAFLLGAYLAYGSWTGRYRVRSFAGICPRCGAVLSLGFERTIDLPHTLTCFHCHFEPRLEVIFPEEVGAGSEPPLVAHGAPECVGLWTTRWLADEQFVFCERCLRGSPATPEACAAAQAENARAALLDRLSDEGRPLI